MKSISIVSERGNHYEYDNGSGFIYLKSENPDEQEDYILHHGTVKAEEVKEFLYQGYGFRHLILEVTNKCNLRCKYCVYGESYKNTRCHGEGLMEFETAKRALDDYFNQFKKAKRKHPFKKPLIGFYGGEPLLNSILIKECVKYIRTIYDEGVCFSVTTNGLLLQGSIVEFLVANDFAILISLDGDKENHDRNRIKVDGTGSFDQVYHNIIRLKEQYPTYNKISLSCCYDYKTDILKWKEFFEKEDLHITNITKVSDHDTIYYDDVSQEDRETFYTDYRQLEEEFFQLIKEKGMEESMKGVHMPLFGYGYINLLLHSVKGQKIKPLVVNPSTCIPGEKIYVSYDGTYHMCERINCHFPIGNIETGLDYNKIVSYINSYNEKTEKCRHCPVSRLCNICFATATKGDQFQIEKDYCQNKILSTKKILENYVNIMESHPEDFERLLNNHMDSVEKVANKVGC